MDCGRGLGIGRSGLLTALSLGKRIGIISILPESVPRHRRLIESLGIDERIAADLPIGLGVAELSDEARVFGRLVDVAGRLRDEHRADVLVLGCAGMSAYRGHLEREVRVSVIDPTQAAAGMALTAARPMEG